MEGEARRQQPGAGDDATLVQRTLAGDQAAFEPLVARHERLVFRVVSGFFRSQADVEDVAQETFVRAFRGLGTFRLDARFAPWIARIAASASVDRLRQRQRRPEVPWDALPEAERRAADSLAAGHDVSDRAATRDLAERALSRLRPADRALLLLVDAHGLTPAEAAPAVGLSALATRVRLHRARRALRREVETLLDTAPKTKTGDGR